MRPHLLALTIVGAVVAGTPGSGAAEVPGSRGDPVVLTFRSGPAALQMELGLIEEISILVEDDSYGLNVFFSLDGTRYYRRFLTKLGTGPVDLLICRDSLSTLEGKLELSGSSIMISGLTSRAEAEKLADRLWYGDDCDLYLAR